jgi:hypothetical protein
MEEEIPRRECFLLPLISLLTIGLLSISTELIARRVFSESKTSIAKSMVLTDPSTGAGDSEHLLLEQSTRE